MVTFAPGQLVEQTAYEGRIWRLDRRTVDPIYGTKWRMTLMDSGSAPAGRPIGDTANVSELWLTEFCHDYSSWVNPPLGDGVQTCKSFEKVLVCTSAQEAIEWFTTTLRPDDVGWWFGWESTDLEVPDLICHLEDGALVWSEP